MGFESFPKPKPAASAEMAPEPASEPEFPREFHIEDVPEVNDGSKIEWTVTCGKCGQEGHSSDECPNA